MNEQSLSDTNLSEEEMFAAISKAVAEGNSQEINRLMALEGELKESEDTDKDTEAKAEEEVKETPDETAETKEVEEADKSKQSDAAQTTAETDPEAAKTAASTPTKDTDEIAELKRELHALRSDAGRMRHVQSRMHQLENELRAYRARASSPNVHQADTSTKSELPAKLAEKLKELKEIDPGLAETFEAMAGMIQETKQSAEQVVSSKLQEDKELEFYNQQYAELLTAVPQAPEIFASNEWKEWKSTLTPGQRAMAESGHAVDVVRAIHAFAADMRALQGKSASKPETNSEGGDPKNETSVPAQQPTTPNPEVTEARNRKLQTTAAVKTPAAKQVLELDEEAYFSEAYNKLAKKHHIK